MEIQNLSQLKKALKEKHLFVIASHKNFPERIGEVRYINKLQTNGFYSKVKDNPASTVNIANRGLGSWLEYGKAINWTFLHNGLCENYIIHNDKRIHKSPLLLLFGNVL